MCNTSNALYALVLSKQMSFKFNGLKLFAVNSGSRSSSLKQFQAAGPRHRESPTTICGAIVSRDK